jgi:hypothetical protein
MHVHYFLSTDLLIKSYRSSTSCRCIRVVTLHLLALGHGPPIVSNVVHD